MTFFSFDFQEIPKTFLGIWNDTKIEKITLCVQLIVEEWLKKALEDDNNEEEIDEISDDFDDCSIEVIDQD